jgi:hypothetical protein
MNFNFNFKKSLETAMEKSRRLAEDGQQPGVS